MDYFLLNQDKRYTKTPCIMDLFENINVRYLNLVDSERIDDITVLYVRSDKDTEYIDVLEKPLFMISEKLKKLLDRYNADIVFKMVPLIDFENNIQKNYYLPVIEEIEALSSESEFGFNKFTVKKAVLDEEKIKGKKIFKIKESDKTLVVIRLDVAESILRRDFKGISIKRLEVSKNKEEQGCE